MECRSGRADARKKSGGRSVRLQASPERRCRGQDNRGVGGGGGSGGKQTSWRCPDLLFQFQLFSKFGESGSDGSQITLTQSDKWLRQAKVIDGWNVTTTDTAIAFRKISRGSIWLIFSQFREFLEELIGRKGLNLQEVTLKCFPAYSVSYLWRLFNHISAFCKPSFRPAPFQTRLL